MAPSPVRRLDHIVIAVRDLDAAVIRYRALGFDARPGGRHTGRGTHNAIVRFGLDYLELIAVYDAAEASAAGRSELVDFLAAREGPVAYALATDDIGAEAERIRAAGLPVIGPFAMERVRPDGSTLSWRLVIPGDGGDVRDLPAARHLYADVLGLSPLGADAFRVGTERIEIVQAPEDGPVAIALAAATSRDLEPAIAGARIRLEA